jgi:transposase
MSRRPRRSFTEEFKQQAVQLVKSSGKSVHQVAKDLDLTETTLREWVQLAEAGKPLGGRPVGTQEQEELLRLREENRQLRMERDFLKKAAAFFAKETK